MAVVIRSLDDGTAAAWDRFVRAAPAGTFFHRAGWARVVQAAFGHATHYCFTERDGAITGVLPLARVKTRLFGDSLISSPFCVYGGPLAADTESSSTRRTTNTFARPSCGAYAARERKIGRAHV